MADFSAYAVTGTDNPAKQISVDEWNELLADLETATDVAGVTPQQFGAVGDGVTDDYPAFAAAIAYLKTIAAEPIPAWYYKGSPRLFVPAGAFEYYLSDTLDITHTLIIEGEATPNGMQSRLRFADNKTGIRIQGYNTNGASGVDGSPFHYSGAFSIIRNLSIVGGVEGSYAGLSGGEAEYHGIHLRAQAYIQDVYIDGFRGDGIHALTGIGGGGAIEGNSNVSTITRVQVTNVRNGVYLDGADANAWTLIGVNGSYCRQHTVYDSSFLGNTHIGHHSANAGLVPGVPASVVSHGGNRYGVKQGQAVGASTNAPTGAATDNTWWLYMAAGAASAPLNIPAWSNGVSVREGGGYRTDSLNGFNVFIGCYQEGGESPSQFVSPTAVIGGLLDARGNANKYNGANLIAPNGVHLGETLIEFNTGSADEVAVVQNSADLQNSYFSRFGIAQGANADGTPCTVGQFIGYSIGTDPATNTGAVAIAARKAGGTFDTNHFLVFDPYSNAMFYPNTSNLFDLGHTAFRWKTIYGMTGDFTTQVKVNAVKVLGAQGAAVADATDAGSAITQLNALLARARAHGLIAT